MASTDLQSDRNAHAYFGNVSEARYVLRKVFRIAEEQARSRGIDPLSHQALIQIYGSRERKLRVSQLAERLDITPPFTSTLLTALETDGLVTRTRDVDDQRVTWASATGKAVSLLIEIDEAVETDVRRFAARIPENQRERALETLKFYVGLA